MRKKRLTNLLIFLALFTIEVFIALFVRDNFIRPFVGDILVVMVMHYFIRIFFPDRIKYLLLYIFSFAVFIEFTQLWGLAEWIGGGNRVINIILGTSFSVHDILCYAVGCILTGLVEYARKRRELSRTSA